jgi:hypothetical protein
MTQSMARCAGCHCSEWHEKVVLVHIGAVQENLAPDTYPCHLHLRVTEQTKLTPNSAREFPYTARSYALWSELRISLR